MDHQQIAAMLADIMAKLTAVESSNQRAMNRGAPSNEPTTAHLQCNHIPCVASNLLLIKEHQCLGLLHYQTS